MRRMPTSSDRVETRRAKPAIEGLEERWLLSVASARHSVATGGGILSHHGTQFSYTTPTGGHAVIQVVGLGNLALTNVGPAGLNLVFGGTNAYSKIVGHVTGGGGTASLASIENSQLIASGAQDSLSGVGGSVLKSVYLSQFSLVPGGDINLTSGVNTLVLDNIGAGTEINLRELPPAPSPTTTSTSSTLGVVTTQSGTTTGAAVRSTTTTSGTTSSTLQAGQSTSITNEGVTTTYQAGKNGAQTLTAVSGSFTAGSNIVEPLPTGTPGQTPRPAPPGVIVKVNQINGNLSGPIDLRTDPEVFGYDSTTGNVVLFKVNLSNNTAQVINGKFVSVNPSPLTPSVGLSLGFYKNQEDLLVANGSQVTAYNAVTGTAVGSFTVPGTVTAIATVDTATVLQIGNSLELINLTASLNTGAAVILPGSSQTFTPAANVNLLGGLTSLPGSTSLITAVGATFDSFQATVHVVGTQPVNTTSVKARHGKKQSAALSYSFTPGTASALSSGGVYIPVTSNPAIPGAALGSIDQSTALAGVPGTTGVPVTLSSGSVVNFNYGNGFNTGDELTALSQSFRPDLNLAAVIDVQGDVQSIRGGAAMGLVLNDNGNLNLVQFSSLSNSTIVGQPVGHLNTTIRDPANVLVLTPSRTINSSKGSFTNDGRNGVTVDTSLQPIGPLTQANDLPPSE